MGLINAADLDTSPPEWLVDGLIPRTGYGVLHGPSYTGKSLVVDGELALAVANGAPFFGRATVRGSVVLCLGEGLYDAGVRKQARLARQAMDNAAAVERIRAVHGEEVARAFAGSLPPYTDSAFFVVTEPFAVPIVRGAMGLGLNGGEASFEQTLAALKQIPDLELVILDSLSDFSGGLSISNDTSANRYVQGIKRMVRELDCVVLVIAHDTVDGKKMLGAQRFFNAADFVLHVIPEANSRPGEPPAATVSCTKSKYGSPAEPFGYVIEPVCWDAPVTDDDGNETGATVVVSTATVRQREIANRTTLRMPGSDDRQRMPLPDIRVVPITRKRNGIRGRAAGGFGAIALIAVLATALTTVPNPGPGQRPPGEPPPAATALAPLSYTRCAVGTAAHPLPAGATPCRPPKTGRHRVGTHIVRTLIIARYLHPHLYRHYIIRRWIRRHF